MTDRALRMRLDVDVRGDDEVGLGAQRTGPPGPPLRDGELAVVLGTALARAALAGLPADRRAAVARDLSALDARHAAADLAARRVPGAAVHDLRREEQVGARGWGARALLAEGATPPEAVVSVDPIRLPQGQWTDDWAARVPWMVPALVGRASGGSADAMARSVLALRALGEQVAASPDSASDHAVAARAAAVGLGAARPVPGAGAFTPAPPVDAAVTMPVASEPPTRVVPAPPPVQAAPDRRLLAALAAAIGVAVLALVLVFAIIASPASFGIAGTSEVNERLSVVEAGVSQLRGDVGTLAQQLQSGGGTPAETLQELRESVDELRGQVQGLCSVLPVVC
ncbi:MAG: hypothetical protein ISP32_08270 [Thermoleophilia bacterium]|nr:hypothetical protein [Thermoleophilia bacterium]